MTLSVIIATYNRKDVLEKAIRAYLSQVPLPPSEVLVVDDGSSDGTEATVARYVEASRVPVRYFRQENRGQATARNVGIRAARGEVVLFTDDDIVPSPGLVARHQEWHRSHPEPTWAVLGHVTWSPEVRVTPFMKWYGERGPLLNFHDMLKQGEPDFRYFYTGNVSLKTQYLREKGLFDEDFRAYGWEDIELGFRLIKQGLRLGYNPEAIGFHCRYVTFADACRKAQTCAATRRVFEQKEAGKYLLEMERRRDRRLARRLAKPILERLVPILSPLRMLMDSVVPLPSYVYKSFYWFYGSHRPVGTLAASEGAGAPVEGARGVCEKAIATGAKYGGK